MTEKYPLEYDTKKKRFHVLIEGEFCAKKIRNTFLEIMMNQDWNSGSRTVLWNFIKTSFPPSFTFTQIFETTMSVREYSPPGKSAAVIETDSEMEQMVSDFYRSIAASKSKRKIEIFKSVGAANAWLDQVE